MKKTKLKIAVTAFLSVIMFNLMTMTVHAEIDESGNSESMMYQYHISYTIVSQDLSKNCYNMSFLSDVRIGYLITGKTTVKNSFGNPVEVNCMLLVYYNDDINTTTQKGFPASGTITKIRNTGTVAENIEYSTNYYAGPLQRNYSLDGVGTGYYEFKTDIPIFDSQEDIKNYLLTGDASKAINSESIYGDVYDDTLPGVTNMSVRGISEKECHQTFQSCAGCLHLSWGTPEGYLFSDTYTIKVLLKYNYTTYYSTKRYYGSTMVDLSEIYSDPVYIHEFGVDLCAYEFGQKLDLAVKNQLDYVDSFDIQEVQKIYIRSNRRINGKVHYGDWYVYDCKKKTLSWDNKYEHVGEGTVVAGDAIFDDNGNILDEGTIKDTIPAPEEEENGNFFFGIDFTNVGSVISNFYSILQSLIAAIGSFPQLFSTVFLFLPQEINSSFVLLFYMALIIGLVKIFT